MNVGGGGGGLPSLLVLWAFSLCHVFFVFSFSPLSERPIRPLHYIERERERERDAQMDVAQLVRLPNGDQVVMGSTPTFHSGI